MAFYAKFIPHDINTEINDCIVQEIFTNAHEVSDSEIYVYHIVSKQTRISNINPLIVQKHLNEKPLLF